MKCIYCYEKDKKNVEFNVDEAISILKEMLRVKTEYGTKIKLHGGEPFLSFQKIKQLCESLWSEKLPEFYRIHITTNGTLIHGEMQEWLYANREKLF
ncbi:MAG: radical SAM protein [Alistipes sp.]|nr:radical SAM protein [Alistipes sp.]